jgi:hypothetical protein
MGVKWIQSINNTSTSQPAFQPAHERGGVVYNLNKPYSTTPFFWDDGRPGGIDVTPSYRFGCTEDPLLLYYYCICSKGAELDKLMHRYPLVPLCWRLHGISHAFQPSLPVHAEYIGMSQLHER